MKDLNADKILQSLTSYRLLFKPTLESRMRWDDERYDSTKVHARNGRNDLSSLVAHLLIRVIIAVSNFFYKELLKHLTVQTSSISYICDICSDANGLESFC